MSTKRKKQSEIFLKAAEYLEIVGRWQDEYTYGIYASPYMCFALKEVSGTREIIYSDIFNLFNPAKKIDETKRWFGNYTEKHRNLRVLILLFCCEIAKDLEHHHKH